MELLTNSRESQEDIRKRKLGELLECIRITLGLTQSETAKSLSVSQSSISKIENGDLTLTAFQWCDFAQRYGIPLETIKYCYLDKQTNTVINSGVLENGYEIPARYSTNKCLKVRYLLSIINYMERNLGRDTLKNFLESTNEGSKSKKSKQLRNSFFSNLDNQINLRFLEDLVLKLKSVSEGSNIISDIAHFFSFQDSHGMLSDTYEREEGAIDILKYFIKFLPKYNGVFTTKILDKKKDVIVFSADLNEVVFEDYRRCSEYFKSFLENLFEKEIQSLPFLNSSKAVKKVTTPFIIHKEGSWRKGSSEVIFDVRPLSFVQ